jgi:glycosyltransferase involved in cell wall biosynthesis
MKKKIFITIITPTFNAQNFINKHLKLTNKLVERSNTEVIYIDDHSIDNTYKQIITNKNSRIRLYKMNKNHGPGICRNYGIQKAKGQFILFLDSDDKVNYKNFLKMIKNLKKKNYSKQDIIFYNFTKKKKNKINPAIKKISKFKIIKNYLRLEMDMSSNFCLFNINFLKKNNLKFNNGIYEDISFMLSCFCKMKKFTNLNINIYNKFFNINSITNTFTDNHLKFFLKSCLHKKIIFKKEILNKIKNINFEDLQFGLRGDFVFASKIFKHIKKSIYTQIYINNFFKKIITNNFVVKTNYDIYTKKILFN